MTTDNFCFYLQNRLVQTSQTGGQLYSDTSFFSIPWMKVYMIVIWCPIAIEFFFASNLTFSDGNETLKFFKK